MLHIIVCTTTLKLSDNIETIRIFQFSGRRKRPYILNILEIKWMRCDCSQFTQMLILIAYLQKQGWGRVGVKSVVVLNKNKQQVANFVHYSGDGPYFAEYASSTKIICVYEYSTVRAIITILHCIWQMQITFPVQPLFTYSTWWLASCRKWKENQGLDMICETKAVVIIQLSKHTL